MCMVACAALTACVPRGETPPPRPAPIPQPTPQPPPAPPPPAPPLAWEDAALAPGDWIYSASGGVPEARFAAPGGTSFALRCDSGGQIRIVRPGTSGGAIDIVTGFGERVLPAGGGTQGTEAALPSADSLFDQIAFSRGRFLVRVAGSGADLILPSWPEPARLIEECRTQ